MKTNIQRFEVKGVEFTAVDIRGISKAGLLAAMYNNYIPKNILPLAMGKFGEIAIDEQDAEVIIKERGAKIIEYMGMSREQLLVERHDRVDYLSIEPLVGTSPELRNDDGSLNTGFFNRVLLGFDYVKGRGIKANLSGEFLVPYARYPDDFQVIANEAESKPKAAVEIFGKKISLRDMRMHLTEYESPPYANKPGLLAEMVDSLQRGDEPPNMIPEVVEEVATAEAMLAKLGIKVNGQARPR